MVGVVGMATVIVITLIVMPFPVIGVIMMGVLPFTFLTMRRCSGIRRRG